MFLESAERKGLKSRTFIRYNAPVTANLMDFERKEEISRENSREKGVKLFFLEV